MYAKEEIIKNDVNGIVNAIKNDTALKD